MSAAPFDTSLIRDRLRDALPSDALRDILGAAELAKVQSLQDFPAPCAYVLLAQEKFNDDVKTGFSPPGQQIAVNQVSKVTFGVVLAVRNYREQRGAQVVPELDRLLNLVRHALLGFVPKVNGARPCRLAQGALTNYDAGIALWTDVWQTQHIIGVKP